MAQYRYRRIEPAFDPGQPVAESGHLARALCQALGRALDVREPLGERADLARRRFHRCQLGFDAAEPLVERGDLLPPQVRWSQRDIDGQGRRGSRGCEADTTPEPKAVPQPTEPLFA